MEGLLLVDKPVGWTSFDVVKYVRQIVARYENLPYKRIKVGHSGTLDPFATGLLVVLVGRAYTALANDFLKLNKTYCAVIELGKVSSTGDVQGEIKEFAPIITSPTEMEIRQVMESFRGEIMQTPPAFSALKINGVRAYKLARDNQEVKLSSRPVTIEYINLTDYNYPFVEFETTVSSGTYIRSLAEDIGYKLGTGAYCRELRRTAIGDYSIEQSVNPKDINEHTIGSLLKRRPSKS